MSNQANTILTVLFEKLKTKGSRSAQKRWPKGHPLGGKFKSKGTSRSKATRSDFSAARKRLSAQIKQGRKPTKVKTQAKPKLVIPRGVKPVKTTRNVIPSKSKRTAKKSSLAPVKISKPKRNLKYTAQQIKAGKISRTRKTVGGASDKRIGGGQRKTRVIDPRSGKPLSRTQMGEAMEHMATTKGRRTLTKQYGKGIRSSVLAGKGNRATFDITSKTHNIEVKTVSSLANRGSPKVGMKSREASHKISESKKERKKPAVLVMQMHTRATGKPTGLVTMHSYDLGRASGAGLSRRVNAIPEIGRFNFTMRDFDRSIKVINSVRKSSPLEDYKEERDEPIGVGDMLISLDENGTMVVSWATAEDVLELNDYS